MTEEDLLSVKYAVNTHLCFCVCALACTLHSRVTVNMSEWVSCDTDELLYSDGWETHGKAALGGVSMSHTCHAHIHTKVFLLLPHTHTRACAHIQDISTHSVTPSQIKTNGFILFSRGDCYLALFFMRQKCILWVRPRWGELQGVPARVKPSLPVWIDGWLQASILPVVTGAISSSQSSKVYIKSLTY